MVLPVAHILAVFPVRAGVPVPVQGKAVQVDPIKHVSKAPGTILLKLRCDGPLSNVAFKINLRRHSKEGSALRLLVIQLLILGMGLWAGAYTRPLIGST